MVSGVPSAGGRCGSDRFVRFPMTVKTCGVCRGERPAPVPVAGPPALAAAAGFRRFAPAAR